MITSTWFDTQHTILLQTYHANWQWKTLHQHHQREIAPLLTGQTPIAVIHDLRAAPYLPGRGYGENVKAWAEFYHNTPITTVVLVVNPAETPIATMLQLSHLRYRAPSCRYEIAHTLESALKLIESPRTSFAQA
ncbi:MAG: hypothetical protein MUF87_22375 [Anaerolineae bacterium]|jgi:hypothetical protein|nr:hypothetical protein [Anaerolineae bacterium]